MADVTISQLTPGTPAGTAVIPYSQGGNTNSTLASNLTAGIISSVIKQIQYNYYDGVWYTSSTTKQEVPGFSVTITPTNASSKIIFYLSSWGGSSHYSTYVGLLGYIYRSTVAGGDVELPLTVAPVQANDRAHLVFSSHGQYDVAAATIMMVDTPNTTAAVTYKIYARAEQNGYNGFINRSANGATGPQLRSWIYAVEF